MTAKKLGFDNFTKFVKKNIEEKNIGFGKSNDKYIYLIQSFFTETNAQEKLDGGLKKNPDFPLTIPMLRENASFGFTEEEAFKKFYENVKWYLENNPKIVNSDYLNQLV